MRLAVVGHEAVDESVRSRLDEDTGEGAVEEVGVVRDLSVETLGSEVGERLHGDDSARRYFHQLLELLSTCHVIVAELVEIGSGRRSIALISESGSISFV